MPVIATGLQTRQKDCYATSERVRLVLRTNGEELNSVISPQGTIVPAGFDAPILTPTGVVSGGGTLSGYYVYFSVYASSKYPYVENVVTVADGKLWPRSNPSPASAVQDAHAGSKTVTLTVETTARTDVDKILIYRTVSAATSAAALALGAAGTAFYLGSIQNYGVAGTATFPDTGLTDTGEQMELDNYSAPSSEFDVFDGTYFWVTGSPEFSAAVTVDGTAAVVITGEQWFTGRNGQVATFDGINSGGFDSAGSYYLKVTGATTGSMYADQDLTVPAQVSFTGTTTIRVRGFTNILYRSKPFNPFSWGITENIVTENVVVPTPETFVQNMGGGAATALAISPNGKRIIIDFENPQRTIAYDLEQADSDAFGATQVILDNTASCTCNFSQFNAFYKGKPSLFKLDTYNGEVLVTDGYSQLTVDDPLGAFLQSLPKDLRANKFIHGQYDPGTQLAAMWMRLYDTDEHNNICVWYHDPSGEWGWYPDFDVLCSTTVLDTETSQRMVVGGTELGFMGRFFANYSLGATGRPFVSNWMFSGVSTEVDGFITPSTNGFDNAGLAVTVRQGSAITQTSPSGGVFRSVQPIWVVGQQIAIWDANNSPGYFTVPVVTNITQISDTVWETTVDAAYTTQTALYAGFHPRYASNTWMIVTNADVNLTVKATDVWYVKPTFVDFGAGGTQPDDATWTIDYWFRLGDTTLTVPSATALPWPQDQSCQGFFGGVPMAMRCYFDLETPTVDKRNMEFWLTRDANDSGTSIVPPLVRFYIQFAETSGTTANPQVNSFGLIRDKTSPTETTATGLAWYNKTQLPSNNLKEYGFEIIDANMSETTLFNYTVVVKPTA